MFFSVRNASRKMWLMFLRNGHLSKPQCKMWYCYNDHFVALLLSACINNSFCFWLFDSSIIFSDSPWSSMIFFHAPTSSFHSILVGVQSVEDRYYLLSAYCLTLNISYLDNLRSCHTLEADQQICELRRDDDGETVSCWYSPFEMCLDPISPPIKLPALGGS